MRFTQALAATAATLSATNALHLLKPRDTPKVIQHDIQRKHIENPVARDRLRRRSGTVQSSLTNDLTLYLMNVTIGTPAQKLYLHLDTGSSDLWVNAANSSLCTENSDECEISGTYDASDSSTYKYLNDEFNITYADGSGASGDYITDTVTFGGATLTNQEMGVGYVSTSAEGILGIGYATDEAILEYEGTTTYVNVPLHLVQSGYINSNAYSLWLNDLDASTGSILFGGVDTDKFSGELLTVPIIPVDGEYVEFVIALTAVGYNGDTGSIVSDSDTSVLLDSGSSLIYLPNTVTEDIYTLFGAEYDTEEELAYINCDQDTNTTTIDLTFSGATISVALKELVILYGSTGKEDICILGIAPAEDSQAVLGDTFLRSAYVVYDLYKNEISLAQTVFNATTSNILEITNSTIPSASLIASAVSTVTAETTGGAINGGNGQITGVSTVGTSTAAAAPTPTAMYGAAIVGAVGAGLMAVL